MLACGKSYFSRIIFSKARNSFFLRSFRSRSAWPIAIAIRYFDRLWYSMIDRLFSLGFIVTSSGAEGCSAARVKIVSTCFTTIVVIFAIAECFRMMAPPLHSAWIRTETLLPAFILNHRLMTLFTAKGLFMLPIPIEKLLDRFGGGSNLLTDFFVDSAFSKKPQSFSFLRICHWHSLLYCLWPKKQPRSASVVAIQPQLRQKVKRLRKELSKSSEIGRDELKSGFERYHGKRGCYHQNKNVTIS